MSNSLISSSNSIKGRENQNCFQSQHNESLLQVGARENSALLLKLNLLFTAWAALNTKKSLHPPFPFVSGQSIFTPVTQQIAVLKFHFSICRGGQGFGGDCNVLGAGEQFCLGGWISSHFTPLMFRCLARPQKTVMIKEDQSEI